VDRGAALEGAQPAFRIDPPACPVGAGVDATRLSHERPAAVPIDTGGTDIQESAW
jgi:hypothetical protein